MNKHYEQDHGTGRFKRKYYSDDLLKAFAACLARGATLKRAGLEVLGVVVDKASIPAEVKKYLETIGFDLNGYLSTETLPVTCGQCGRNFEVGQKQAQTSYCSETCRRLGRLRLRREARLRKVVCGQRTTVRRDKRYPSKSAWELRQVWKEAAWRDMEWRSERREIDRTFGQGDKDEPNKGFAIINSRALFNCWFIVVDKHGRRHHEIIDFSASLDDQLRQERAGPS